MRSVASHIGYRTRVRFVPTTGGRTAHSASVKSSVNRRDSLCCKRASIQFPNSPWARCFASNAVRWKCGRRIYASQVLYYKQIVWNYVRDVLPTTHPNFNHAPDMMSPRSTLLR